MITPAFHKSVLIDFVEVMNEKAEKMIDVLQTESKQNNNRVDMLWPLTLCALDIIVETAMGQESNIQLDRDSAYAKAIFSMFAALQLRQKSVQYWSNLTWKMTKMGQQQERDVKTLLDFTKNVIDQRWTRFQALKVEHGVDFNEIMFGEKNVRKNRIAFLGN